MNINKEIAEKVMGWTINTGPHPFIPDKVIDFWDTPKGARTLEDFEPKTNIRHAMEVEAEMFRRGYKLTLQRRSTGEVDALFQKIGGDPLLDSGYAISKTPEEAVCLAALGAVR